jgi:C4-dicarboxylate-specific signal transduction histidine kinase
MSAGIAHEINNPPTIIAGTARSLPRFVGNEVVLNERIQTIQKAVERISKIVGGLRKFSRASEHRDQRPCSLRTIIAEALTLTTAKSQQQHTPVLLDIQSDAVILCNEIELEQVIINLVNNGIDAVHDLADKWVQLRVFERHQAVVLEVIDSGNGIPVAAREELFVPFLTTKPVGHGTGLGLAIVKGILDGHYATIEIDPTQANTCFRVTFPQYLGDQKYAA